MRKFLLAAVCIVLGIVAAVSTISLQPPAPVLDLHTAQLATLDGKTTAFSDLPPARRLVNFWATWCAPCIHEMPLLQQAADDMPDVHFSGIALDHADLVRPFVRDLAIKYDILTPKFDIFLLFEEIGNESGVLPYTILMDENGAIVARKIGEFHSAEEIKEFISAKLP